MLSGVEFQECLSLVDEEAPPEARRRVARRIRARLNPHPASQLELNVPQLNDEPLPGVQHKYRETVLFFPAGGQTCHTYCSYCFRWPQFVGESDWRFATRQVKDLVTYLKQHEEVTDVLITGGDPLVMTAARLRRIVEPLLAPELSHVRNIRIGTKALSYWPHRFLTDPDADDLLRLFAEVPGAGRHLAFMAHLSHPRELEPLAVRLAAARVRATGAVIRCQTPLVGRINDKAAIWSELWRREVQLGMIPYYMFVGRPTGGHRYFEVPLARALRIYQKAFRQVSGLARTARGPSMSATAGKVIVRGTTQFAGERVFVLEFEQGRNPDWVGRPFFARYDETSAWLSQLRPPAGRREFFFEPEMKDFQELAGESNRLAAN